MPQVFAKQSKVHTHAGSFSLFILASSLQKLAILFAIRRGEGGWGKTKRVVVHFVGWLIEYMTDEKKLLCNAHL
jgi:hypothetical protein